MERGFQYRVSLNSRTCTVATWVNEIIITILSWTSHTDSIGTTYISSSGQSQIRMLPYLLSSPYRLTPFRSHTVSTSPHLVADRKNGLDIRHGDPVRCILHRFCKSECNLFALEYCFPVGLATFKHEYCSSFIWVHLTNEVRSRLR